jgi:hypothetical protein
MYPLTCAAGFPMPLHAGKYEIYGMSATVDTIANDARVRLYDDRGITDTKFGRVLDEDFVGTVELVDVKGIGNGNGNLEKWFSEPIKTRNGISVSISDNIIAGSLSVYVR